MSVGSCRLAAWTLAWETSCVSAWQVNLRTKDRMRKARLECARFSDGRTFTKIPLAFHRDPLHQLVPYFFGILQGPDFKCVICEWSERLPTEAVSTCLF